METIFDHKPTVIELIELFAFDEKENTMAYGFSVLPLPVKDYDQEANYEEKLFDLAILFELRGQFKKAKKIWLEIPEIERQYRCGFDNVSISLLS